MKLAFKLSEHPFYRLWQKGQITHEQLSAYAHSYREFIKEMPYFWNKALTGLKVNDSYCEKIVNEEKYHDELWKAFQSEYTCNEYPLMTDVINEFNKLNHSELLGAIHAFEVQQPEVAQTKKEGLLKYYGFEDGETQYFDEHLNEAEHIAFGSRIAEQYADKKDFESGFQKGSEIVYNALDRFLN